MPANLTVEYFKAEEKYRVAKTKEEKIKALEEMLRGIPKHKGTEHMQGEIKRKIAKLKKVTEKKASTRKEQTIRKEGAARVCIVGLPNSGKSYLLSKLTNAKPHIADYEYTTTKPEKGMLEYKEVKIQVIEIPPTFSSEYSSTLRDSDLLIILLDSRKDAKAQKKELVERVGKYKLLVNEEKPKVKIRKQGTGGIIIRNKTQLRMPEQMLKKILIDHSYHNAIVSVGEPLTVERLYQALDQGLAYVKAIYVEGRKGIDVKALKQEVYENLNIIRVFTKSRGEVKHPPIVLKKGSKVRKAARDIHKDFVRDFRYAKLWGPSAKFEGEQVGLEHVLKDGDIVEVHTK